MESPAKENAVPISKPEVVSKIEATIPIISEKESSSNGMDAKTEKTPLEETYKEPTLGSGTKFDNEEDGALPELPQEIEEFKNPRLGEPLADGDSEKLAGDGDLDEILREALTSPLFEINGLELEEQLANSTKKGYGGDEPMDQAAWGSLPNNERLEANSGELGMSYRTLNMDMFGFAPPSSRNLGHVRYSLVSDNAKPLTKALSFEGAWKVASSENLCIPPGRTYNVETGILMYIGPNTYMQTDICGESPVQVKGSILDDYDFGMLRIVINNPTNENQFIKIGDVVANLIFTNLSFPEPTLTKEEQMRAYLEILQKSRNINRFPKSSKMGTTTLFPVLGSQNLVVDNADTQGDSLETSEAKRRSDNQKKDNLEANKEVVGEKTKETLQNEVSTSTITRSDEEDKFVDDTLEAALDSSKKTDSNVKSAGKHRWVVE
ncbi:unnamed protein product [Orchesella dallaii]|uniref:Uncharacterized protein n=1 Tax=Orchesella dallaii TaxID=48710 RepID=A0ABP1S9W5_9HEXA